MKRVSLYLVSAMMLVACSTKDPGPSQFFSEMEWRHEDGRDATYLLAPGDELDIIVHTAPELSRTVIIGPDGRFRMPYSGPITASARTVENVRTAVQVAMASELKDPDIDVLLTGTSSQRIFVGGEVTSPGMFDLPGLIDPLQAIIMAGGITDAGRSKSVVLMRRMPGGEVRSAIFDIKTGIYDAEFAHWTPLRRFDVIYVPRKPIADQNLFIQQYIRNALPIDFTFYYDVAGANR
ncbi:MAG: polysaccharide export protein [Henriciella sp.]|nr:polysaccharide export protein [Henriciella sp.]